MKLPSHLKWPDPPPPKPTRRTDAMLVECRANVSADTYRKAERVMRVYQLAIDWQRSPDFSHEDFVTWIAVVTPLEKRLHDIWDGFPLIYRTHSYPPRLPS